MKRFTLAKFEITSRDMKKLLLLLLSLALAAPSFSSTPISSSLYPYIFDVGSYWVYEKDGTNILDSLVQTQLVQDSTPPVIVGGNLVMGPVEYFQMHYESKTLSYSTWDQMIGYVIVDEGTDWANDGPCKLLSSYQKGDSANYSVIKDTLSTMVVAGHTFSKVTKMLAHKHPVYNNQPAYYYYSQGVGMIRKELLNADHSQVLETWNLINWQTVSAGLSTPEEPSLLDASFYPNPTKGTIYLDLNIGLNTETSINAYDLYGRFIMSQKIHSKRSEIDLSNQASGMYILEIRTGDAIRRLKVMKE